MSRCSAARRSSARTARGFTLIEVLAVMLLMGLVLGVALDFYVDLSNASTRASESTRVLRRAASLLDRVAADFENTLLVRKPEETDPLAHPWIFLGESYRSEIGADRLKFVTRRSATRRSEGPVSDLETVAYVLRPSEEDDSYALYRWSTTGLPESLDREFPADDNPASVLLADGLSQFGVRFQGEDGAWIDAWDSSQMVQSGELPVAVEIRVAMHVPDDPLEEEAPRLVSRLVLLPMRALDLEQLLDPATYDATGGAGQAEDDEAEEGELTLADCVDFQALEASTQGLAANLSPEVLAYLQRKRDNADVTAFEPYREYLAGNPAVREECR
ncbi:MAG: prepilin-type N-terminal cleavage/methylation domain-containing protein [Myxococcales bacterium]|nr:prepilin-type N-terminal cleavage/methylation domain-containing protein [Myxococcales bacterium]